MIAFFEYCFQVLANRIGSYEFTAAQRETIQEVITLTVFAAFSVLYLKQPMRWNNIAGVGLIVVAVAVILKKWERVSGGSCVGSPKSELQSPKSAVRGRNPMPLDPET